MFNNDHVYSHICFKKDSGMNITLGQIYILVSLMLHLYKTDTNSTFKTVTDYSCKSYLEIVQICLYWVYVIKPWNITCCLGVMSNLTTLERFNHTYMYPRSPMPTLAGRGCGWVDRPMPRSATPSHSHGQNHASHVVTMVKNMHHLTYIIRIFACFTINLFALT
jgi:hypothetical protein